MQTFSRFFFTLIIACCSYVNAIASHAVGADIYYECIGANRYRVYLNFYRDCAGISAPTSASVTISSAQCNRSFSLTLTRQSFGVVPSLCPSQQNNSTCNGGSLPGIEQFIYAADITLPAQCSDWRIGYDLCCRNSSITNLSGPGNQDLYVEARLNNTNGICNNAPFFTTLPVPYICAGQQYFYNHGAVDVDGDSLVYSLVNPLSNPNSNIPYRNGNFNVNNPMTVTGSFQFDVTTGQMTFTPSAVQNAVVTILVREFRNGVLIGSTMRDIQVVVLNCNNAPPVSSPITNVSGAVPSGPNSFSLNVCAGNAICFDINTSDPNSGQQLNVAWNSGIPGATFTTSGTPPVGRFCWTPTTANLGANNFIVEVTDNACPIPGRSTRGYTVNVLNATLNTTTNVTNVSCPQSTNGTASVSVSNGVAPIRYLWSTGATTASINNLAKGTYTVTVSDAGGCPSISTVTVNGPPTFNAAFTTSSAVCNGEENGTALIQPSGGNGAPFSYQWSNGETTAFIDSLPSSLFQITVTDAAGCAYDTAVFIFQPGPLIINATASTTSNYNGRDISCAGASDGEITLIISGGTLPYIYNWSPNANGQNDSIINNLSAGFYSVTLYDQNNCNTGAFITLNDPPPLTFTDSVLNGVSCFGANDGRVSVTVSGGTLPYNYTWSANANNQTTPLITNLDGGIYTVTMADVNGCSLIDTLTVIEPGAIQLNVIPISNYNGFNITCNGFSDGRVKADITGGAAPFSYQWSSSAFNQTTQIAYDVPIGNYSVTVTDDNGCTISGDTSLIEPPVFGTNTNITSNYNGEDVSCYLATDGDAESIPFGGVPPYNFFWINANQTGTAAVDLGADSTYRVRVTDANECVLFDSIILSQPTPVIVNATITSNYNGADVSCVGSSDGTASAFASGGMGSYSYRWSNSNVNDSLAINLSAGIYTVTATDLNGCTTDTTITLVNPDSILINISVASNYNGQDISCFGNNDGIVNATASGGVEGFSYQWDNAANNQTSASASNLAVGSYSVTATDLNGCTISNNITISQPDLLTVNTVTENISCFEFNDGNAIATANGGTEPYNFNWNTNANNNNNQSTNIEDGNYGVTVTDINNCTATNNFIITQPDELLASVTTIDATCFESFDGEASLTVNGGTLAYTYDWSNIVFSESTNSTLERGDYTVTITDANGCSLIQTFTIGSPPPNAVDARIIDGDASLFFGDTTEIGAFNISANVPNNEIVSFVWTENSSLSCDTCAQSLAYPLFTSLYQVVMTDIRGCIATDTVTIFVDTEDKILYVPNAFSPDGDGINDVFYVYGAGISGINFSVFNRWGEKVFQSNSQQLGWDGAYKGTIMYPGAFVYYVEATYLDGDKKTKKGSVTLIR